MKRISIREILGLIAIIALAVTLYLNGQRFQKLEAKSAIVNAELGHINESGHQVYIRQLYENADRSWRFRIKLPDGVSYTYRTVMDTGNPMTLGTYHEFEGQFELIIRVVNQFDEAKNQSMVHLEVDSPSMSDSHGYPYNVFPMDVFSSVVDSNGFVENQAGFQDNITEHSEVKAYEYGGDPIVLLELNAVEQTDLKEGQLRTLRIELIPVTTQEGA